MLIDHELLFSDAQAITATANSTNVVDLGPLSGGNLGRDIASGEEMYIFAQVGTTFTAGGAATLTPSLVTDDNSALSSPTTLRTYDLIAVATLAAGYQLFLALPINAAFERYIALTYTVATGPMTAGTITAGLIKGLQQRKLYPSILTTV